MTATPRIVDFRHPVAAEASAPAPDRLLQGQPRQEVRNHYSDPTGQFHAGVWSSTPGKWRVSYTEHEFCRMAAGRVILTADDGAVQHFGAGDAFVIPAGFSGTWETVEAAVKHYVIFEPKA
jgi:uncharacterized protein